MRILVTGGNGFIAKNLCPILEKAGHEVVTSTRTEQNTGYKNFVIGQLDQNTRWQEALEGVDCVIHLAARVHIMNDTAPDPLSEFMLTNYHATKKLAETAQDCGVKKFIFASSIQVNGETSFSHPFCEEDVPTPSNPYAVSKLAAEKALTEICKNMDLIIVRLPLLYGPYCKGNFYSLIKLCKLPIPLPFGGCKDNKRSLLYVDNFSHFITKCLTVPGKTGLYLIGDKEPVSTADIIKYIRVSLGMKPLLLPFPGLSKILSLIGKKDMAVKLTGSLEANISKAKEDFLWDPPYTTADGIQRTVTAFNKV